MTWPRITLSRQTRICIVLCINFVFFLVELVVGHMVNSLALIADSFHLLNDIMSLIIGLYAIKLSKRTTHHDANTRYTYGWHRAEILAALVNAVFLLALSFSIFVDAMSRFADRPEVENPRLVVIVGCIGLASGLTGMVLFHEHGHGHSHRHGHSHGKDKSATTNTSDLESQPTNYTAQPRDTSTTSDANRHDAKLGTDLNEGVNDPELDIGREPESDVYFGHPAATRAYVVQAAREMEQGQGREGQERSADVNATKADVTNSLHPSTPSINPIPDPMSPPNPTHSHATSGALNMRGLMLHVFGDALGNVGVIVSGLIIWFAKGDWRFYMDPVASLIITMIIAWNTVPLTRSASYILLQCVPRGISLQEVGDAIRDVPGVEDVHELHIWQLSENKVVASVHVRVGKTETDAKDVHMRGVQRGKKYMRLESVDDNNSQYYDGEDEKDDNAEIVEVSTLPVTSAQATTTTTDAAARERDFMRVAAEIRRRLHDRGIHSSTIQPEYMYGDDDEVGDRGGVVVRRLGRAVGGGENGKSKGVFGRAIGRMRGVVRGRGLQSREGDVEMGGGADVDASTTTMRARVPSCLITCPPDQQECNPAENACCPPPKLIDI